MLQELLHSYIVNGFWFFLAHVVLTIVVAWNLARYYAWEPVTETGRASWESFEVKTQFARGLIGLYLLIGIAGTFYGLFEFAINAQADDASIKTALTSAIAKAFPVGFVGLIAGLVWHGVLDLIEKGKSRQLEDAERSEAVTANTVIRDDVVPLLRSIDEETRNLKTYLGKLGHLVQVSMQPVADLRQTLGDTLQPVVIQLGASLSESTALLREQGNRLEEGKTSLIQASELLASSAARVEASFSAISEITASAKEALKGAKKLTDHSSEFFYTANEGFATFFHSATETVEKATSLFAQAHSDLAQTSIGLSRMPDTLSQGLAEQAERFGTISAEHLSTNFGRLYQDASLHLVNAFAQVQGELTRYRAQVDYIGRDVDSISTNFINTQNRLAEQIDHSITTVASGLSDGVRGNAERLSSSIDAAHASVTSFNSELATLSSAFGVTVADLRSLANALAQPTAAPYRDQFERTEALLLRCAEALEKQSRAKTRVSDNGGPGASATPSFPSPKPAGRERARFVPRWVYRLLTTDKSGNRGQAS